MKSVLCGRKFEEQAGEGGMCYIVGEKGHVGSRLFVYVIHCFVYRLFNFSCTKLFRWLRLCLQRVWANIKQTAVEASVVEACSSLARTLPLKIRMQHNVLLIAL